jgi:hypothetical protein
MHDADLVAAARSLRVDPDDLVSLQSDIRMWIEMNRTIAQLQSAIRDRRLARDVLYRRVVNFMRSINVDNLAIKSGDVRVQYRTAITRPAPKLAEIKDRIHSYFKALPPAPNAKEVLDAAFERGQAKERPVLLCRKIRN